VALSSLNAIWVDICDLSLRAIAFGLFTMIFIVAARKPGTGHRFGLVFGAIFCGSNVWFFTVSVLNLLSMLRSGVWHNYQGHYHSLLSKTISSIITLGFAMYAWYRLTDIVIALRRDDLREKLAQDAQANVAQRQMNLLYVATEARVASERSLNWAQDGESNNAHTVTAAAASPHSHAVLGLRAH
jgi:hypothetical protein